MESVRRIQCVHVVDCGDTSAEWSDDVSRDQAFIEHNPSVCHIVFVDGDSGSFVFDLSDEFQLLLFQFIFLDDVRSFIVLFELSIGNNLFIY